MFYVYSWLSISACFLVSGADPSNQNLHSSKNALKQPKQNQFRGKSDDVGNSSSKGMDQGKGLTVNKAAGMSNSKKAAQKNTKPHKRQHEFEYDIASLERAKSPKLYLDKTTNKRPSVQRGKISTNSWLFIITINFSNFR